MKETVKESASDSMFDLAAFAKILERLPAEALTMLAEKAGLVQPPTTIGMTAEQFQAILATNGKVNAKAMQQALRRENLYYPDRSVYNPAGVYDDEGRPLQPKVCFKRDTYQVNVMIGRADDSEGMCTPEEIGLLNRFTTNKETRGGAFKAEIVTRNGKEVLRIIHPYATNDERVGLPPLTHILLELLEGEDAVNPDILLTQVAKLRQQVAKLEAAALTAA